MRGKATLFLFALLLVSPGCSLISDGVHDACTNVEDAIDDCRERHRNYHLANEAWARICQCHADGRYTDDYASGFKDGFADYLFRGGKGDPPPVAPARYRKYRYQTPEGYRAIEDWFAGYRHGVVAARETQYRRWITGPSSTVVETGPPSPVLLHPEIMPATNHAVPAAPETVPVVPKNSVAPPPVPAVPKTSALPPAPVPAVQPAAKPAPLPPAPVPAVQVAPKPAVLPPVPVPVAKNLAAAGEASPASTARLGVPLVQEPVAQPYRVQEPVAQPYRDRPARLPEISNTRGAVTQPPPEPNFGIPYSSSGQVLPAVNVSPVNPVLPAVNVAPVNPVLPAVNVAPVNPVGTHPPL